MTINPNDPWYPAPWVAVNGDHNYDGYPGVSIRLKLAAEFAAALATSWSASIQGSTVSKEYIESTVDDGVRMADAMIDRANRDEGSADGK